MEECNNTRCEYNADYNCVCCDDLHNPNADECISFIDKEE